MGNPWAAISALAAAVLAAIAIANFVGGRGGLIAGGVFFLLCLFVVLGFRRRGQGGSGARPAGSSGGPSTSGPTVTTPNYEIDLDRLPPEGIDIQDENTELTIRPTEEDSTGGEE